MNAMATARVVALDEDEKYRMAGPPVSPLRFPGPILGNFLMFTAWLSTNSG
jgi:hypothetical protein